MSIITTMNKQEDLQSKTNRPLLNRCTDYIVNKSWRGLQPGGGFAGWALSQVNAFENVLGGRGQVTCDWPIASQVVVTWRISHEQIDRHDVTFPHSIVGSNKRIDNW